MEIKEIGSRGILFTFDELSSSEFNCLTNIYVINSDNRYYILDTFLGPRIIEDVLFKLDDRFGRKPVRVFNSHADWDHIWGNSYLKEHLIIAQKNCYEKILNHGEKALEKYGKYGEGKIEICPPNLVFKDSLSFPQDEIEFFHSPGHTDCSASCYDKVDKILFVGDNVEEPLPYIQNSEIETYIRTLKSYLEIEAEIIITGHGEPTNKGLIKKNIIYLESLVSGEKIEFKDENSVRIHKENLKTLGNA